MDQGEFEIFRVETDSRDNVDSDVLQAEIEQECPDSRAKRLV